MTKFLKCCFTIRLFKIIGLKPLRFLDDFYQTLPSSSERSLKEKAPKISKILILQNNGLLNRARNDMNSKKWCFFFWLLWFSTAHGLDAFFKAVDRGNEQGIVIDPQTIDKKSKTHFGRTALLMAAHKGHLRIVKLLLENNASLMATDNSGWNALHLAAHASHDQVVAYLINHVKRLYSPNPERVTIHVAANDAPTIENLKFKGFIDAAIEFTGSTALHKAAETGHSAIVLLLLAEGADFNAKNQDNDTPIQMANKTKSKNTSKEIIKAIADISLAKLVAASDADTKIISSILKDYPQTFTHNFLIQVVLLPQALSNIVVEYLFNPLPARKSRGEQKK